MLPEMPNEPHFAGLYSFWQSTSWKLDTISAPTTWLPLFLFYRFLEGGCKLYSNMYIAQPSLGQQLNEFIGTGKKLIAATTSATATTFTATHKSNKMLLQRYGILRHIAALKASFA